MIFSYRHLPLHSYLTYKDEHAVYNLVMPGKEKVDFDVNVKSNFLIVKCGGVIDKTELSDSVDVKNISAEYKAGILKVKLPYKEESKPKKIEVT